MGKIHNIMVKCYWKLLDVTYRWLPDALWLKIVYKAKVGRKLDLKHPKTFTEKLQWLKLHDHNPLYTTLVDKYEVKQYIKNLLGDKMVIPLLGVWNSVDDIDFDSLPTQFVLKCTHDSGTFVICKDKMHFDIDAARNKIRRAMKLDYWNWSREWAYKNVKPRVIAEKFMTDGYNETLTDYKFFCFNGEPKMVYISHDVAKEPQTDFFDMEWNHLPFKMRDPNAEIPPEQPAQFKDMADIARKLSKGIPHVRVDLYVIDGKIYFGEMTFYHNSGIFTITPDEWDYKIGQWLQLPKSE